MMKRIAAMSPGRKARIAGVFYLLTIVTGALALIPGGGAQIAVTLATVCYLAVTLLFYDLFKPVSRNFSALAAVFSLAGCVMGLVRTFDLGPTGVNNLVFFGGYCVLIGYLIVRSTFLPRVLGVLMAFAGFGWFTFFSPSLAGSLAPYNMAVSVLGESVLCVWLIFKGVNEQRWREQAAAAAERRS